MDLAAMAHALSDQGEQGLPPVEQWHPSHCGKMDLVIKSNGEWIHEGQPFTRPALVKLFASVLKKEGEDYFLVTPVEKVQITVEDCPFVLVGWRQVPSTEPARTGETAQTSQPLIELSTQLGDKFIVSQEHPIELRTFNGVEVPYCLVRRNLWGRLHQNVMYQWAELALQQAATNSHEIWLHSGDYRFSLGKA